MWSLNFDYFAYTEFDLSARHEADHLICHKFHISCLCNETFGVFSEFVVALHKMERVFCVAFWGGGGWFVLWCGKLR